MTSAPEQTLERLPWARCGVIGEGEEALVELLSLRPRTVAALKACPGLVLRTRRGIVRTVPRRLLKDLDRLAIPRRRSLTLDWDEDFPAIMMTGRGCTGRCAFCFEGSARSRGNGRLRLHSAERCLEEFGYLAREFGNGYITILDDSFVADPGRLREFCQGLIARYRGKVKWFCEARADTLSRDEELLPLMIEAGLVRIQVGGESGCQHILDAYRKGTTLEQVVRVVEAAGKHGLFSMYLNFIIGGAHETRETCRQTLEFALDLLRRAPGCVEVGSSFFTPYPGTPIYEQPEAFGLQILDGEVVRGPGTVPVSCRTKDLDRFEVLALGREFDRAVLKAMREMAGKLPFEVVQGHFEAYYKLKLLTKWYEVLSEDPARDHYFRALYSGRATTLAEIPDEDLEQAVPHRVVQLAGFKGKRWRVYSPLGTGLELDSLNSLLFELSAGKLNFGEIIELVGENVSVAKGKLRQALTARYRHLDQAGLVLWTTEGHASEKEPGTPGTPRRTQRVTR